VGCNDKRRFELELEFLHCLANPGYLNCKCHASVGLLPCRAAFVWLACCAASPSQSGSTVSAWQRSRSSAPGQGCHQLSPQGWHRTLLLRESTVLP
jgi:hypothetical protein